MNGPCIALDVSKGSTHYRLFLERNKPVGQAKIIAHNKSSFDQLLKEKEKIEAKANEEVTIVFESTGVYHKGLERYLKNNNCKYFMISPLLSAKVRKSNVRSTKNDKKDCNTIAETYYTKDINNHPDNDHKYSNIRAKQRYYEFLIDGLKKYKVEFNRLLDIIYPGFDGLFSDLYSKAILEFLLKYPHPDMVRNSKVETIARFIEKKSSHHDRVAMDMAIKIKKYLLECYSGCDKDEFYVEELKCLIMEILAKIAQIDEVLKEIIEMAKELPGYENILTIPGIGENLAARLIAEIGDFDKYENSRQLVASAGLDPTVYQSGQNDGKHLKITKKGNKHLRTLLFLAVTCMINNKHIHSTSLTEFYENKMASGLSPKAAKVATMNKSLRIIYTLVKSDSRFI